MKCGHGNSEKKCIYPKCQEDCGKERVANKRATDCDDLWHESAWDSRLIVCPTCGGNEKIC